MSNNFHSTECALRHRGKECTCGYKKPLSKLEEKNIKLEKENTNLLAYKERLTADLIAKQQEADKFLFDLVDTQAQLARNLELYTKSLHEKNEKIYQLQVKEIMLTDLLAVLHRDGGHHEGNVGTERAVEDAMKVYYSLRTAIDDAADAMETGDIYKQGL
jgi:hypothetical protein